MQDRIKHLENLVLSLMQETASSSLTSPSDPLQLPSEAMYSHTDPTPSESGNHEARPPASRTDEIQRQVSPSPSDYGSIRIQKSAISYVSSAHWAAVLDSIAGLRDHFEQDDESHNLDSDMLQPSFPSPHLLYGWCPPYVNPASILECLPPRAVVDRLVSRYFNIWHTASGKYLNVSEGAILPVLRTSLVMAIPLTQTRYSP